MKHSILLVGCGYWGKNWYRTIQGSKHSLWGVVDPKPVIDVEVPCYDSIDEVLHEAETGHFTHAILAIPAQYHYETFEKLVDAGISAQRILVEKPCGVNVDQAWKMKKAFPGFIFLHDPLFKYMDENIDQLGYVHTFDSIRASMGPRIRTDVSIFEDYLIHDLYLFAHLIGLEHCHQLKPTTRNHFLPPNQTSQIDLSFIRGHGGMDIQCRMFSSWWWPRKDRRMVIVGTDAAFIWEGEQLFIVNEYYDKLEGTVDKWGNVDYELVSESQDIIKTSDLGESRSNLEIELDTFMSGERMCNDELLYDVWKFMYRLQELK